MKKKSLIFTIIMGLFVLIIVLIAIFASLKDHNDNINVTVTNNIVSNNTTNNTINDEDIYLKTSGGYITLDVTKPGNVTNNLTLAAENTTVLTIEFSPHQKERMTCNYEIFFEWEDGDRYSAPSSVNIEKEMTLQGDLTRNDNAFHGIDTVAVEINLSTVVGENKRAPIVMNANISGEGNSITKATWTFTGRVYLNNSNKNIVGGKKYSYKLMPAKFKCVNASNTEEAE